MGWLMGFEPTTTGITIRKAFLRYRFGSNRKQVGFRTAYFTTYQVNKLSNFLEHACCFPQES